MFPAWNPSGTEIALGGTRYYVNNKIDRRISIYSDLLSEPKRRRLHSEEYLEEYFGSKDFFINEGSNGIAWSPDGTKIAYGVSGLGIYNGIDYSPVRILIANADGSGITNTVPLENVGNPTWSPDSQHLIFNQILDRKLWLCDRNGSGLVNLSKLSEPNDRYGIVAWAK